MSNNLNQTELDDIYSKRFGQKDASRQVLWSTLTQHYFQNFIDKNDTVLDLAAGYCEFINNIDCKTKYAVDMNPETKKRAAKDVKVYIASSDKLPPTLHGKVDKVFVSNFFEHLDDKHQLLTTLSEIRKVLKPGGTLMVLQPNISRTGNDYWNFVDHSLPINDKSLCEALELSGFVVSSLNPRFLPYTSSSSLPIHPLFIRLYLKFRPAQWLLGKQIFAVAQKPKAE
ncbi:MAG: class I SAM-dependent methyltransferase [Candidatus Saccharimonadales bacterium]